MSLLRQGAALAMLAASTAALLATSKSPYTYDAEDTATVEFSLEAGETRSYTIALDAVGVDVYDVDISAVATAVADESAWLTLALTHEGDSGIEDRQSEHEIGATETSLSVYDSVPITDLPPVTLTAGEDSGLTGTLEVTVSAEWYDGTALDTGEISLSVALVADE